MRRHSVPPLRLGIGANHPGYGDTDLPTRTGESGDASMYIGVGTLVLILIIIVVVLLLRRA